MAQRARAMLTVGGGQERERLAKPSGKRQLSAITVHIEA
jgi:hypothetical protein